MLYKYELHLLINNKLYDMAYFYQLNGNILLYTFSLIWSFGLEFLGLLTILASSVIHILILSFKSKIYWGIVWTLVKGCKISEKCKIKKIAFKITNSVRKLLVFTMSCLMNLMS